MLKSIKCELYKSFSQLKTFVIYIVIALIPFLLASGSLLLRKSNNLPNDPEFIKSITFDNLNLPLQVLGFVSDLIIPIFIMIFIADLITEEYINGTLKLPLLTPLKRHKLILSKTAVIIIQIVIMLTIALVCSYLAGSIFFGFSEEFQFNSSILSPIDGIIHTIEAYGLSLLVFISFSMLVMFIAINLNGIGAVIGSSIGLLVTMSLISSIGEKVSFYILGSYFKFFNVLFLDVDNNTIFKSVIVILLYGIISMLISIISFTKKDILY